MEKRFTSHRPQAAKVPAPEAAAGAPGESQALAGTAAKTSPSAKPKEIGGPSGPEPTRYGDWERKGICYDF